METITAKGVGGTVSFDGRFVTIVHKGFLGRMTVGKGEKRIPIGAITAVQWKEPGHLVNGFVQFTMAGGNEARSSFGHQTFDAVGDENSMVFDRAHAEEGHALRDAVEAALAVAVSSTSGPSLREIAEAHAAGILTDEEFTAAKRKALGI